MRKLSKEDRFALRASSASGKLCDIKDGVLTSVVGAVLYMVVNCYVSTGNQSLVVCKNKHS